MKIPMYLAGALLLAGCNASPDKSADETRPATQAKANGDSLIFADAGSGSRPFTEGTYIRV